jgi:hypothetical protein
MNKKIVKLAAIAAVSFFALGVSGPTWAQGCINPDPKYPITSDLSVYVNPDEVVLPGSQPLTYVAPAPSIPAPSVSEFDGSMTCASTAGLFGGPIPNAIGISTFTTITEGGVEMQFTVESFLDNGKAVWKVVKDEGAEDDVIQLRGIDSTISASNKGSKGCKTTFGVDAGSGRSAYEKSNDTFVASDLYVCANTTIDSVPFAPPEPVEVAGCSLQDGEEAEIYGVTVYCSDVPSGEERSIYVAKNGVPGFGFVNAAGEIDFANVCTCNGPVLPEPLCDPSPLPDDPVTDALDACVITEDDVYPPLLLIIQNPICVGYGSSRRCY